ncbi:interleukin-26 [Ctenodactylus gundi]
MWVNCISNSGLLCATLFLSIAKPRPSQSFYTKRCCSLESLSLAVDIFYIKAAQLKTTISEDRIKNVRLLKKKNKRLFMKSCRFQEQLLSFFVEDVFGQLQLHIYKDIHFVEDFQSLSQKLRHCISCKSSTGEMKSITKIKRTFYGIGNRGIYKAISELNILLSWIKELLENFQ